MISLFKLATNLKIVLLNSPLLVGYLFSFWGSFLNVLGLRLITDESIVFSRSVCPSCKTTIAWYDLIPVLSWIILHARCRRCKAPIGALYPLFELLTALVCTAILLRFPLRQSISYIALLSALITSSRSDIQSQVISRFTSLYLVPLGILLSLVGWNELSAAESLMGAFFGFGILYLIARLYHWYSGMHGLGIGDCDLLALIGSFLGISGAWCSLVLASCIGCLIALPLIAFGYAGPKTALAFGPFLSIGALITIFYQPFVMALLLPH